MAEGGKREPLERPGPTRPLLETVEQGLRDPEVARRISVELRVSGGMPAKAYDLHVRISGGDVIEAQIRDPATGRRAENKGARMDDAEWSGLLRTLRASRVLDVPEEPPRFLPDTIVGYLRISDGESEHGLYFVADENQAKAQNKVPPAQITRAVDALYRIGGQLMEMQSVKP